MNPTRHNYVPMTVTGDNRYSPRMNSMRYAYTQMTMTGRKTGIVRERKSSTSQIWPDDRDGGETGIVREKRSSAVYQVAFILLG